ncbi:hypothetical protein NC652_004450 [Populus alba x Populus x berolinensis]|nr:hypothetical protein NC652_004450 [Populus alba x Populus x berolinensis]
MEGEAPLLLSSSPALDEGSWCCWLVGSKPSLFSPVLPYSSVLWRSSPCDFVLLSVPRAALRLCSFSLLCERNMFHRPGLSDRSGFCGGGAGGAGGAKLRIWICWIYGSPLHLLSSGLAVFHHCHGRSRIWPIGWRFSSNSEFCAFSSKPPFPPSTAAQSSPACAPPTTAAQSSNSSDYCLSSQHHTGPSCNIQRQSIGSASQQQQRSRLKEKQINPEKKRARQKGDEHEEDERKKQRREEKPRDPKQATVFHFASCTGRLDVGCDRMTTPLGINGLSFAFCLSIAIMMKYRFSIETHSRKGQMEDEENSQQERTNISSSSSSLPSPITGGTSRVKSRGRSPKQRDQEPQQKKNTEENKKKQRRECPFDHQHPVFIAIVFVSNSYIVRNKKTKGGTTRPQLHPAPSASLQKQRKKLGKRKE